MKDYIVSLDAFISTKKPCVSSLLKTTYAKKTVEDDIVLSLESNLDKSEELAKHINNIIFNDDIAVISQHLQFVDKLFLNIGVFHDTATCTVVLSSEILVRLVTLFPQIYVKTVCYPCEPEHEQEADDAGG